MHVQPAYAKINLSLEIVGSRPDGYHDLVSVMQTVSLADRLRVAATPDIRFTCSDPALASEDNLVVRAARLLRAAYDVREGCHLALEKRIPVAAGLGGGSSDAATTLLILRRLWRLQVGLDELQAIAAELGSDVPFFLVGGTALVEGRGERVTPLRDVPQTWLVLAAPDERLPTATVYGGLTAESFTGGTTTSRLAEAIDGGGALTLGRNGLQAAAFQLSPGAASCFGLLCDLTGGHAILSGSGPTSVGLVASWTEADGVAGRLRARGYWAEAVRTIGRGDDTR